MWQFSRLSAIWGAKYVTPPVYIAQIAIKNVAHEWRVMPQRVLLMSTGAQTARGANLSVATAKPCWLVKVVSLRNDHEKTSLRSQQRCRTCLHDA